MKKIETANVSAKSFSLLKIVMLMKLTIAMLLLMCLQVSAKSWSQDKITLNIESKEIKKVLTAIEKKSNYRFLYNEDAVKRKPRVSIQVVNAALGDVLDKIFANTNISYKVLGTNLVVLKEDMTASEILVKEQRVSGKVTDTTGAPLAGVSIAVKGTSIGTTTDENGNYSLTVSDEAVLVFSSIGYLNQEVSVNNRSTINISLVPFVTTQDEVVVIGYGTAQKRDLTGSIVKIGGEEVANKPNINPVASLAGKVAGLSVIPAAGIGKTPDIRIRGTISIGSVRPLYVVDGILNDNIDFINPNDIESMEILKDPSSLAIFGVRGAGGVITVTTKRAKSGQVVVNFNSSVGVKRLVDKIDVLTNGQDFKTLYEEENANIGVSTGFDFTNWNANTDWIDAVTQTGIFNNNNLSVTASSDKNRFYAGLGYITEQGVVIHEKLKKYLFNMSNEYKFNNTFKMGVNFNVAHTELPNDGTGTLESARRIAPVVGAGTTPYKMKIYGADSANYNLYSALPSIQNTLQNPLVGRRNTWDKYIGRETRFVGSIFGEVNFLKDFNFRVAYYGDQSYLTNRNYSPLYAAYDPDAAAGFLVGQQTSVSAEEARWAKYQQDYILNYKKRIGDHNIQATAGWTTYYFSENHTSGNVKQSPSGAPIPNNSRFWYLNNDFADRSTSQSNSYQKENATTSVLLRGLYNFKNRYYFNASFRRDGSSLIYNPDQRYQNFWALGAAWDITREDFMQSVSVINFLKLKASIGVLGNQNTYGVDYPYFPTLQAGNTAVFGNNVYPAYVSTYTPDPNLRWETVHGKEIGLEFGLFENKLTGEINYYDKLTKDMLAYLWNGPTLTLGNFGSISNKGLELMLNYNKKVSPDFSYTISGNLTTYKNKVIEFGNPLFASESSPNQTQVGFPIGYFYGYVVDGIYQSYADKIASPTVIGYEYGPGDLRYKDLNNDGVINTEDRTLIGNPTPDFTYGASFSANYKGLDVGIDLQGSYGAEVYRVWGSSELPYSRYNYPTFKLNRWHGEGTSNWVPRLGDKYAINRLPSTFGIEDGSFLRIRNIQIGYNFKKETLSRVNIKNLRVFANVQNLKTFKRNSGYTPELSGGPTDFGVDWGNGAIPVVYTVGFNVSF